jgi:hypothetical protein
MYLKQLIRDHLYQEVSDTLRDQLDPISYDYSLSLLDQKITPSLERFDIQVVSRPPLNPDKCHARTWSNHKGNQCKHTKVTGDYCKTHQRQLNDKGYLEFGRYDEKRPRINQDRNNIPWYDDPPFISIDIMMRYQLRGLHKLISRERR